MNREMRISVIMPVYNVEPYIKRCFESILHQTYTNLEIIVIDDGSTDRCLEIAEEYAKRDDRFKIIHQENGGICVARNHGLAIATGDYISFLDPDDWIHPQYFEVLLKSAQNNNADIAVCGYVNTYNDNVPTNIYENYHTAVISVKEFLSDQKIRRCVWGKIYKKEAIGTNVFNTVLVLEDTPYNIDVICKNPNVQIAKVDLKLYFYFQREGSLLRKMDPICSISVAQYHKSNIRNGDGYLADQIRLQDSIKHFLIARYCAKLVKENGTILICEKELKECQNMIFKLKSHEVISKKKCIIYMIMISFPALYRRFRLMDDPTLKIWEKDYMNNGSKATDCK